MSCPYCGSDDLRPLQDRFGRCECGNCQRRFIATAQDAVLTADDPPADQPVQKRKR